VKVRRSLVCGARLSCTLPSFILKVCEAPKLQSNTPRCILSTSTLTLHEFSEPNIPEYAILSHRWSEGEVLYRDVLEGTAELKPGYSKIKGCCQLALSQGWEYVWVDTCCIDKSSASTSYLKSARQAVAQGCKQVEVSKPPQRGADHKVKALGLSRQGLLNCRSAS
jgi:hypothetical protein